MSRVWLTYAWKDNEENDVDHVINELKASGLEVGFDRAHLLAGVPLWRQLDAALADDNLKAWAIYVTENSLASEPCQEELSYALDRTLRTKGSSFPLIGIFPKVLDRRLIPSALATRLYVNLTDQTWRQQVTDAVKGARTAPDLSAVRPYVLKWHENVGGARWVLEARPRSGRWLPTILLVPTAERELLKSVMTRPKDAPGLNGMVMCGEEGTKDGAWKGLRVDDVVTPETSLYVAFSEKPSAFFFGPPERPWQIKLRR